jgi:hypothetical protein
MEDQSRMTSCPRCGGDAQVDSDGHHTPVTTGPSPCVCLEFEVPPHWRR